jgi:hypothetical protein
LATKYSGVEPRIAALVTEPTDAAFTSLSCSWSDFTSAKSTFLASAVASDAIGYQFSDYGITQATSGAPEVAHPVLRLSIVGVARWRHPDLARSPNCAPL